MIKISACTIVKNEEKNMRNWLASVTAFADEIIVVDTGSQDRTKEIALEAGVQAAEFAWGNDFSAAKNYAIDKAKGDWLVFLDGDEFFAEESQKKVRGLIKYYHENKEVIGIFIPCNNIDVQKHNEVISQDWRMRIFRNDENLRYRGRIHEALCDDNPVKRQFVIENNLRLIHTGYSSDNINSKLRRNLAILLEDIAAQGGEQPYHYFYLQDCYSGLGDYAKAIYYGRLALQHRQESGLVGNTNSLVCKLLNSIRISGLGDYGYELEKAVREFPDLPEVKFFYGQYLLANMQGLEARKMLQDALELYLQPVTDVSSMYNLTFGSMPDTAKLYLEKIKQYESYYMAMTRNDYQQAASIGAEYLQAAYKTYPGEIAQLAYLFKENK